MRERARHGDPLRAAALFTEVMNGLGVDVRVDIAAYIDRGAPIVLADDVFAPCGSLEAHTAPVFSRGFDIAATQAHNNVISGVDPALPAYAAGLRDGMVLIRRDHGAIGDSEREIAYVVLDGQTQRTIAYMPRGHGDYMAQRLAIDEPLAGDELRRCRSVLAGQ
jgi:predicted metalloprotease with PDZ domain